MELLGAILEASLVSCSVRFDSLQPHGLSLPGCLVHGNSQARILEWFAIPFPGGSSQFGDRNWVSCISGRFFTLWASRYSPHIFDHFSILYWHGRSIDVPKSLYFMSTYFYKICCIVFPLGSIHFRLSFFLRPSLSPALPPFCPLFFPFIFLSFFPCFFLARSKNMLSGQLFLMISCRLKF